MEIKVTRASMVKRALSAMHAVSRSIGVKLKKAISVANMQGKRRISCRRSSLLEMAASIKKASELLGEEASIEVATKMKTIDDLEPKVKNMENRLAMTSLLGLLLSLQHQ